MKRRRLLTVLAATPIAMFLGSSTRYAFSANTPSGNSLDVVRQNWKSLLDPAADVPLTTEPIEKPAAEWRQILSDAEYEILREEGTERPNSSPLNHESRLGIYACAGCALPLFSSEMKYESGTGWPSFFTNIPGHLDTKTDFKLLFPRTEYHCVRCGGHQGHVFKDGPLPTGERWCNNGVALRFIPVSVKDS